MFQGSISPLSMLVFWPFPLCLENRLPACSWVSKRGKEFLSPPISDLCFSSPGFVKMEMFISFRGNINLYPKGVNWLPCLNWAIVVLNISFPVWLIQAKITPWQWIPKHEDRSPLPSSISFLLMWLVS